MSKISLLDSASTLTGAELLPIVQGGASASATIAQLASFAAAPISTAINAAGASAYGLYLLQPGNAGKTVAQFLASLVGAQGIQGIQGNAGTNGNTVWNGATAPGAGVGVNGDFYINTATNTIFGPKAAGAWPGTGTSLVGPTGATGASGAAGTNGTNGNTVWSGAGAPTGGVNGDFYINTATNTIFGPKAAGAWPGTGTSLVGPPGATGATGPAGNNTIAQGGTGATTAGGARTNLGAAASGANNDITALTGLTTALALALGGTGATTAASARTNLGAAASGANNDITALTGLTTALALALGGTGATTAASARTNLGAAASGANSDITALTGLTTALALALGGTGATTAASARTNLGAQGLFTFTSNANGKAFGFTIGGTTYYIQIMNTGVLLSYGAATVTYPVPFTALYGIWASCAKASPVSDGININGYPGLTTCQIGNGATTAQAAYILAFGTG